MAQRLSLFSSIDEKEMINEGLFYRIICSVLRCLLMFVQDLFVLLQVFVHRQSLQREKT